MTPADAIIELASPILTVRTRQKMLRAAADSVYSNLSRNSTFK